MFFISLILSYSLWVFMNLIYALRHSYKNIIIKRYLFPFMLKTILLLPTLSTAGKSRFTSLGFFHCTFFTKSTHDFNGCSASGCFFQNSLNVDTLIIFNFYLFVRTKILKSYQIGCFVKIESLIGNFPKKWTNTN